MKRSDIVNLHVGLSSVTELKGVKFAYAVAKNRILLEQELNCIDEAKKPSQAILDYEQERIILCEKSAKKDDKGMPLMNGNSYVIEDPVAFNQELELLRNKHKPALEEANSKELEIQKLLDGEVDIKLHILKESDLPNEITANQPSAIIMMVE